MPCAIWNPASCSGRSRCSVSSEGAEGSAAEPPTARRTRHSLQDTLASDGLRGGDGRYSELRASSRPTLPRPACKVGCSARCARPWHRKSSLPAPPIEPPSPIEPTGQSHTLVLVQIAFRLTFAAGGQKRLWCRRWRRRAHAHARAAAHAHDARVPTRFSAEIARCAAAPWAPGLAEQRLSAGASGTGGERRQQVVELGLAERLAAPVLTPVYACCSPDGGL